jgi:hypothetical protein
MYGKNERNGTGQLSRTDCCVFFMVLAKHVCVCEYKIVVTFCYCCCCTTFRDFVSEKNINTYFMFFHFSYFHKTSLEIEKKNEKLFCSSMQLLARLLAQKNSNLFFISWSIIIPYFIRVCMSCNFNRASATQAECFLFSFEKFICRANLIFQLILHVSLCQVNEIIVSRFVLFK